MIDAPALARRMAGIEPIGLSARGTIRLAWTAEAAAAERWFAEQATGVGLGVERDPAGNLWACPESPPPWWATGSHLDSVREGGRFDGALGVAAAFEVAARSERPLAVLSFADEEGARFNTPTFGSRALTGRLDVQDVLTRRDDDGVVLADAMSAAGLAPGALVTAPSWLGRLRGFVELHIDQSRAVAETGSAAGVVGSLAARMRVFAELRGTADHAGTTGRAERRDALAAAARLIVAAHETRPADPELVVTCGRLLAEPNALTTIASRVRLWLDARAPAAASVASWREAVATAAAELAAATRVGIELTTQSSSPTTRFDDGVRAALTGARRAPGTRRGSVPPASGAPAPEVVCFAGHDAGVLAERVPAGMVLVRNESGLSHAPGEAVALDDAATGAEIMLRALEELA